MTPKTNNPIISKIILIKIKEYSFALKNKEYSLLYIMIL